MIITNQESPVITTQIDVNVTKTIFKWYSTYQWKNKNKSPHSHCLLRIYWLNNKNKAIVIASELYSNHTNTGVYRGYYDLASSVVKTFPQLKPILASTIWLTHSGQFSYPLSWAETGHENKFRQIFMEFDENGQTQRIESSQEIEIKEIITMLEGAYLEPGVEVLEQLKHDNGWNGIVDTEQVQACQELEEGIVLGQKRVAGLVG
ncbi:MAG: hypothetical protein QNJ65_09895 [Xenococcaceae cyanobacterium MO_234.B1]|nr:hypothetical protein [Xenococcaceae cyanobacterium MO_234.B1]